MVISFHLVDNITNGEKMCVKLNLLSLLHIFKVSLSTADDRLVNHTTLRNGTQRRRDFISLLDIVSLSFGLVQSLSLRLVQFY